MADDQGIELARLDERFKAHATATTAQFAAQNAMLGSLSEKVDNLTGIMNQGRGAYTASLLLAGTIGSAIMAFIQWIRH